MPAEPMDLGITAPDCVWCALSAVWAELRWHKGRGQAACPRQAPTRDFTRTTASVHVSLPCGHSQCVCHTQEETRPDGSLEVPEQSEGGGTEPRVSGSRDCSSSITTVHLCGCTPQPLSAHPQNGLTGLPPPPSWGCSSNHGQRGLLWTAEVHKRLGGVWLLTFL